jgi:chromosome segregation ATPase
MERKIKENGSESKRVITRGGTREIDGLNSQIKEFKGMVDEFEKDKIKQYEDSSRVIAGYDETIREKDNIIKKLEKCINAKDRQLADCNETIVKLEVQVNELKRYRNSSESPTQDKNIQEKLNSSYKANSELTASLHKEATEKETLIKRLEINNKFHKEEVNKLRTEIERLRKMIKEKCDEKRIEDYEREKKIMQDRIDNLTEMVRIKDEILNRREGKTGNRVYKN